MPTPILIEFPLINAIKFVKNGDAPTDEFQTLPFESDWYINQIKSFEDRQFYKRKLQFGDAQFVQVGFTYDTGVDLVIVDCNGVRLHTYHAIENNAYSGNNIIDPATGTAYQAYTNTFSFTVGDVITTAGTYYFYLQDALDPDKIFAISEPFLFAQKFPNTMCLQYRDTLNRRDVFFTLLDGTEVLFNFRTEGSLLSSDILPKSLPTQYEDEVENIETLYDVPYNVYRMRIGRVPMYVVDSVNRALTCNYVLHDNYQITKDKEAQWTINRLNRAPRVSADILVRRAVNSETLVITTPFANYCTNAPSFSGMTILPAPEFNDITNPYSADRSIVKIVVDPSTSGLDLATITYSGWNAHGSQGYWITTGPLAFVQNRAYNFYQRGADSMENGKSTIAGYVELTDVNGCTAYTGLVIDFAISPPWSLFESVQGCGQEVNSDFVDFTVINITSTTFDVKITNYDPSYGFAIQFTPTTALPFIVAGDTGYATGLTPDTEYPVYVRLANPASVNNSLMGPIKVKTLP